MNHLEGSGLIAEDVCEIIEALEIPAITNAVDQLLEVVERNKKIASPEITDLLLKAERIFTKRRGQALHNLLSANNRAAETVASGLRDLFPFWPHFVYHGTTSKVLASIIKDGLVSGRGESRWKGIVGGEHLNRGVFLTETWRGAVTWAQSTALTRTGALRKNGTRPVILRMQAEFLDLRPDTRANATGCYISVDDVRVDDAAVFVIETIDGDAPSTLPTWVSVRELAGI